MRTLVRVITVACVVVLACRSTSATDFQGAPAAAKTRKPGGRGENGGTPGKQSAGDSGRQAVSMKTTGTVSAIAGDSITVKAKGGEKTFTVDGRTNILVTGTSHKTAAGKAVPAPTPITDFVKVGDEVTVTYHDMGATSHAASVRVANAKAASARKK